MSENDNVKVRVRNLTKCFGDLKVLDNVSFDIQKGDFVCIVGPTGCGKTTFLKCLVRLFSLTEGEILVDGEPADPKKHNLSFVFQNPSHLPWLTVEKNIRYGLELKKYPEQLIPGAHRGDPRPARPGQGAQLLPARAVRLDGAAHRHRAQLRDAPRPAADG